MTPRLAIDPADYAEIARLAALAVDYWRNAAQLLTGLGLRGSFAVAMNAAERHEHHIISREMFKSTQRARHADEGSAEHSLAVAEIELCNLRLIGIFTAAAGRVVRSDLLDSCLPADLADKAVVPFLRKYQVDGLAERVEFKP
jgi:hypothetical protein